MTKTELKKLERREKTRAHQLRTFEAMLDGKQVQVMVEFLFGDKKEWCNVTHEFAASHLVNPKSARHVRIKPNRKEVI